MCNVCYIRYDYKRYIGKYSAIYNAHRDTDEWNGNVIFNGIDRDRSIEPRVLFRASESKALLNERLIIKTSQYFITQTKELYSLNIIKITLNALFMTTDKQNLNLRKNFK